MIDQKAELEQLEEENKRLKSALESSIAGLVVFDLNFKISFVNQVWLQIVGFGSEEFLGKNLMDLIPSSTVNQLNKVFEEVKINGVKVVEMPLFDKQKKIVWLWMKLNSTKDDQGSITGFVGAARDITKQKTLENQLKEKIKELETMNKIMIDREVKMIELKEKLASSQL